MRRVLFVCMAMILLVGVCVFPWQGEASSLSVSLDTESNRVTISGVGNHNGRIASWATVYVINPSGVVEFITSTTCRENGEFSFAYTTEKPSENGQYRVSVKVDVEENPMTTTFQYGTITPTPTEEPSEQPTTPTPSSKPEETPQPQSDTVTKNIISGTAGETFDIALTSIENASLTATVFTLSYRTEDFEVDDLCVLNQGPDGDIIPGPILNTGLLLEEGSTEGTLKFKQSASIEVGTKWTGLVNVVRLRTKRSGTLSFTVSQE